jgi:hypothetical protein
MIYGAHYNAMLRSSGAILFEAVMRATLYRFDCELRVASSTVSTAAQAEDLSSAASFLSASNPDKPRKS